MLLRREGDAERKRCLRLLVLLQSQQATHTDEANEAQEASEAAREAFTDRTQFPEVLGFRAHS